MKNLDQIVSLIADTVLRTTGSPAIIEKRTATIEGSRFRLAVRSYRGREEVIVALETRCGSGVHSTWAEIPAEIHHAVDAAVRELTGLTLHSAEGA